MTLRDRINQYKNVRNNIDIEKIVDQSFLYSAEECGIIHPTTKASLRFRDNGNIEMFTGGYNGMVVSKNGNSFNIFAEKININADKELRLNTDDLGLLWNYYVMNPDIRTVQLVEMTADMLNALKRLMLGGIEVDVYVSSTTGYGSGRSRPLGGSPQAFKPFLYDKRSKLINDTILEMTKSIVRDI